MFLLAMVTHHPFVARVLCDCRLILQASDDGSPAKFDTTVATVTVDRNSFPPEFSPLDYLPQRILETQVRVY